MSTEWGASWGSLLVTLALNTGLALAVGAVASLIWSRHMRASWAVITRSRSLTCLRGGIVLAISADVADLWSRSASAAGVDWFDASSSVRSMLVASHYGHAWSVGMAVLLVLAAISCFGSSQRNRSSGSVLWAASVCIVTFVYTRSMVSHAAGSGDFSVAVVVDSLHLVLIASWVGMVFVASTLSFGSSQHALEDRRDIGEWIGAMSRTATISLVGIVGTGFFNIWRGTGGALGNLPGSAYGTVLFAKLVFVFVAIALGAQNRFRVLPPLVANLRSANGARLYLHRFVILIRIEALTLWIALALAAVLSATEANTGL